MAREADRVGPEETAVDIVLQISPTLQNPTLTLMGEARRREIAEVVRRHALPVVEDDVYGRLLRPHPVSFASHVPE
ncbi:MAG: PLP-dependent aminotransferase family protein, partial [Pseudomonadota bacterium]